jgi:hypothetical protein
MARNTHWYNGKPILNIISFMMVILFCLITAIYTLQCGNLWDFIFSNIIINFVSCFIFIREFLPLLFCGFSSVLIESFNLIFSHVFKTPHLDLLNFLWISFGPRSTSFIVFLFVCFVISFARFFSSIWIISARFNVCNSMAILTPIGKSIFQSGGFHKFIQFFFDFTPATSFHK